MIIFKNLMSFVLPIMVLVVVPLSIEDNFCLTLPLLTVLGVTFICMGLSIIVLTVRMFILIGKGTLAPWSPTRKLVTGSLYGHVRNPMILGVFIVLIGESVLFTSFSISVWSVAFIIINTIYFIFSEEPGLEKRFGREYNEYKKNVPRWIPRLKPWNPDKMDTDTNC